MTITTDRNQTFEVDYAYAPVGHDGALRVRYADARPLSVLAADWEGVQEFTRKSAEEGDAAYRGYTVLTSIQREAASGRVALRLIKEGA